MENVAAVRLTDIDAGDEGPATVRARGGAVAVALPLRNDGDLELVRGSVLVSRSRNWLCGGA